MSDYFDHLLESCSSNDRFLLYLTFGVNSPKDTLLSAEAILMLAQCACNDRS